jgi:predicted nucleic acid-binding protein
VTNSLAQGVLVDTGPLVALLSADDQHHAACVAAAKSLAGPFYTVWPVVTEAAYLMRSRPNSVALLLAQIEAGKLCLADLSATDVSGIQSILSRYADQGFDLADAAVMHVTERDDIRRVVTIDRRHFSLFRTHSGSPLELHPAAITD